jgi:hypothetical protein
MSSKNLWQNDMGTIQMGSTSSTNLLFYTLQEVDAKLKMFAQDLRALLKISCSIWVASQDSTWATWWHL